MNISKNSWHYRTIRNMNRTPSKSLCVYFWQVVMCTFFLYIFTPIIFLVMGIAVAGAIPMLIGAIMTSTADAELHNWIVVVKCWSIGLGFIVALAAVVWFIVSIWSYVGSKLSNFSVDSEKGLLVSYVKAKKQKVCPIIEFKD